MEKKKLNWSSPFIFFNQNYLYICNISYMSFESNIISTIPDYITTIFVSFVWVL